MKGTVGSVDIFWVIKPNDTNDLSPVEGFIHFDDSEQQASLLL